MDRGDHGGMEFGGKIGACSKDGVQNFVYTPTRRCIIFVSARYISLPLVWVFIDDVT